MLHDVAVRRAVLMQAAGLLSSLVLPICPPVLAAADPEQRLYELSQGRRPSDWLAGERPTVDALVDELVALGRQTSSSHRVISGALRGKWRLVFVSPGPQDVLYPGADRRLLFPDLPWNDKYQIVGLSYIINACDHALHNAPTVFLGSAQAKRRLSVAGVGALCGLPGTREPEVPARAPS